MAIDHASKTIEQLRRAVLLADGGGLTDGQLLELFVTHRDEAAFEALVRRHGPMVLSVCRRILWNEHDADDAFQATFLVLVRKAGSLRDRELVGNWLYGTAYRAALETQATLARRKAKEKQVAQLPERVAAAQPDSVQELRPLLDRELSRLPDKYRAPLLLCELEGRKRKEVARQLGIPEGTLSSRLATAKRMLARRLARHGLTLSAGALSLALSASAKAEVPASLVSATVKAALTAGPVLATAALLADGVLKALLLAKLKAASVVLAAGIVLASMCLLAYQVVDPLPPNDPNPGDPLPEGAIARVVDPPQANDPNPGDPLPEGAIARLGSTWLRHAGPSDFVILPDGKTILSAGGDRVLRFWDLPNRRQRTVKLQGKARDGRYEELAALTPDGKLLATCNRTRLVVWDVTLGTEVKTLRLPASGGVVNDLHFSPDSQTLAIARSDGGVFFLEWQTGRERQFLLPHRKAGVSFSRGRFSPDGKRYVAWLKNLAIFEVATGREICRHSLTPDLVAMSPDSKWVAAWNGSHWEERGAPTTALWLFDLASGKEEARFPRPRGESCWSLVFTPDGKKLACHFSSKPGKCLLDCATGQFGPPDPCPGLYAAGATFSSDRKTVVAPSTRSNHRLLAWDVATGKEYHDRQPDFVDARNQRAAVTPDGRFLAVTDSGSYSVSLWDTTTDQRRGLPVPELEQGGINYMEFTADGKTLVLCLSKGFLQFWDVATGQHQRTVQLHDPAHPAKKHGIFQAHVSIDGTCVATRGQVRTSGIAASTQLALWEAATGKLVCQHFLPLGHYECAWLPDASAVVVRSGLMDVRTGKVRFSIPGSADGFTPFAVVSPDGERLAAVRTTRGLFGTRHAVVVCETATGKEVASVATGPVRHLALTSDNRFLVTTDERREYAGEGFLRVWDLATGKERRHWSVPELKPGRPVQFLLSLDSQRAFTFSANGTALVWDLTSATAPR